MHVVVVGSKAFDSLEYHLSDSFRVLGHTVLTLNAADVLPVTQKMHYWASRFNESYDRLMSVLLARKIARQHPHIVVVVYRHIHPLLIDEVKRLLPGVPVVHVNPDALANLEKQQIIAADFDYYFSKDPFFVTSLRHKAGLNAHYLPEGFNPRLHQRPTVEKAVAERETAIDVLVYGGIYAYRARLIEQLIRAGCNVVVYGTEGPYMRPAVWSVFRAKYLVGTEKNRLLYGAKIVFNAMHYAEITSVNQKYFEINGVGAFQLCDYKPTIEEYSGVAARQVTFETMSEGVDKIRYFLDRPTERCELAEQQYAHFQKNHTFDLRVAQLLRTVGLESTKIPQYYQPITLIP